MRRYVAVAVLLALAVAGAPASAGPRRAPAPAAAPSPAQRTAALAELRARLAHRLPQVRPTSWPAEPTFDDAGSGTTFRAGDLDGDGTEELVDVRYGLDTYGLVESSRFYVHRGRDGAVLWTSDLGGTTFVFPLAAKVGAKGTPGLVVVAYDIAWGIGPIVYPTVVRTRVVSYDGKGTTLWSVTYGTVDVYGIAIVAGAYGGAVTYVDGLLDAVPGGGADVLVTTQQWSELYAYAAYTGATVTEPAIIDGATGTARALNRLVAAVPTTYSTPVGDLDGDKRHDVVVASGGSPATATALRSSDGGVLWTAKALPKSGVAWPQSVPDATGDRVADVVVTTAWGPPPLGDGSEGPQVSLLDGRTGAARWKRPGDEAATLGADIDGRPGAEVVVGSSVFTSGTIGMRMAAFGATGRRVWAASRTVSTGKGSGSITLRYGMTGDTNADGVRDVGYRVAFQRVHESGKPDGAPQRNEGVLDGRTGRARRAPARDLRMLPLALDGRGSDAVTVQSARGRTTVTAWQGDAARRLWQATFDAPPERLQVQGVLYADRDRCADLVVTVHDGRSATDYVLSGATGRPLWSLTRSGLATPSVARRPGLRAHRQLARTCRGG